MKLTESQRAELEARGAAIADRIEQDGPDPADAIDIGALPVERANSRGWTSSAPA